MTASPNQFLSFAAICSILSVARPFAANAQEEVLADVFGSATEFNFFWTQVGSPRGDFRPERSAGAAGIGFELSVPVQNP